MVNFEYPLDIADKFKFDHQDRRETEERLNLYYGSKEDPDEIAEEQRVWVSNYIGSRYKFLPFRLYSFDYIYMNDGKLRKFVDLRPLVFILEEYEKDGVDLVKGLNLNFLPKKYLTFFMQGYMQYFGPSINEDLEYLKSKNPKLYLYTESDIEKFIKLIESQFPKVLGCSRVWRKSHIPASSVKVVKIDDYNKIFEYTGYVNSIKGKHWKQVQSETIR